MLKALLVITLCLMAMALEDSPETGGILINLSNGELCAISGQCKSSCCLRVDALSLARCAPRAAEREACSKKSLYETYYICPCEDGLKCEGDWSIGGSIVNTNFGICEDPRAP